MYTIKIQVWKEGGPATEMPYSTHYLEAQNINYKWYKLEGKGDPIANAFDILHKDVGEHFCPLHQDDPRGMVVLGFFNNNGDYQHAVVYNTAVIYIMQNGKTVDKIIV